MRRRGALAVALLAVTLSGCAALPSGSTGPAAPTVAPVVGSDGVARVRVDHRAGANAPAPVVVVPRGGTVELTVGSDTAERVRISGPDQVRYVTAGGTVTMRFVPAGPVTVELGASGAVLARIDVR